MQCANDWLPYHSACYKLFTDKMTYSEASQFCAGNGPDNAVNSDLLTMWDEYELELGKVFLRDDQLPNRDPDDIPDGYWMGLEYGSDRGAEFEQWKWIDGWPVTRSNWVGQHPDINIGRCAFINKLGNFETSSCSQPRGFVCKAEFYGLNRPSIELIDSQLGMPLPCEEGWQLLGHHCNRIFPDALPYHQAQQDCMMQGGNLGSIHSTNFNAFMKDQFSQLMTEARGMWIGMMYKGASKGWEWEDDSEVSYTKWDQGEPNNWEGRQEDCVEFLGTGDWNDELCEY